jgi:hypothetical protein
MLGRTLIFALVVGFGVGCAGAESGDDDLDSSNAAVTPGGCPERRQSTTAPTARDDLAPGSVVHVVPREVRGKDWSTIAYRITDTGGLLAAPTIDVRLAPGQGRRVVSLMAYYVCANGPARAATSTDGDSGTAIKCVEGLAPKGATNVCTNTPDFAKRPAPISFAGVRFSVDCAGGDDSGTLSIFAKDEEDKCATPPTLQIKVTK